MLGARSGGTSTPRKAPWPDDQVADRLAALDALVLDREVARPSRAAWRTGRVRSGLRPTPFERRREPGTSSAATIGNAAEDGSPGTTTSARAQLRLAAQRDHPARARRPRPHLGAEMAQHVLAVVARGGAAPRRG